MNISALHRVIQGYKNLVRSDYTSTPGSTSPFPISPFFIFLLSVPFLNRNHKWEKAKCPFNSRNSISPNFNSPKFNSPNSTLHRVKVVVKGVRVRVRSIVRILIFGETVMPHGIGFRVILHGQHVTPMSKHVKFIRCHSHKIRCIYCNNFRIPTGHKISTLRLYQYPMVARIQLAVSPSTPYSFYSLTLILTLGGKRRNRKSRRCFFVSNSPDLILPKFNSPNSTLHRVRVEVMGLGLGLVLGLRLGY